MNIDSKTVGQNIARLRKLKDIKAATLALQLGMKEAAYTKYERGETAITVEFVQKVAKVLNLSPIWLLTSDVNDIFHNFQHLPNSIKDQSNNIHADDTIQGEEFNKLLQSVVEMNKTLVAILGKKNQ